jgi:hypothetical protein
MVAMNKVLTLDEMEPIARDATRRALEGLPLDQVVRSKLALVWRLEGDQGVFELVIPGARPADAKVVIIARVDSRSGSVDVVVNRDVLVQEQGK